MYLAKLFANSGGVLLFGIGEKAGFQVVGVYDLQELQKRVTEQCSQMEPPVRAVFTVAELDGRWICSAEIPAIDLSERPGFTQLSREQTLEMLNITHDGKVTLAAVMNFCLYPQGYFPQLGITAIVIPGKQIGDTDADFARFTDNKRIEGTIDTMVEDAVAFCRRNMKIRTIINPITGTRNDRTEYPIEAIREAVLNAVIHRDYSIYTEGTPVQIVFFTDRLEIHSPGSLYGRMTVEQLEIARPDLRNPALAVMAEELTSAENRYSGILTIRRAMSEYGLPDPVFENRRNEFVVILYNQSAAVTDVILVLKWYSMP